MYGIFPYIYHRKPTIHVGKYTSPMDPMGLSTTKAFPSDRFSPVAFSSKDLKWEFPMEVKES